MPLSDAIFGDEKSDAADPVDELESALDQIAGDIAETWDDMLE